MKRDAGKRPHNLSAAGDRIRVYRTKSGSGSLIDESSNEDRRDYDAAHYARLLRETFAVRLERAFTPGDYEAVFADPDQMSLFTPPIASIRTVLCPTPGAILPGNEASPALLPVSSPRDPGPGRSSPHLEP